MTGEEVYAALYAIRASRLEPGVIWTGSNDGPVWVTRDGGKTWKNVTPQDCRPAGACTRSRTRRTARDRRTSRSTGCTSNDFKPYLYMTNDYGEHWTLLTDGIERHSGRSADARRARGSRAGRAAVRRHAAGRVRVVRQRASTGSRCSRTCRRRRSPISRSTTAICSRRRWAARSGSWTTSRRCGRSPRA